MRFWHEEKNMKLLLVSSALAQFDGSGESAVEAKAPLASLELTQPIFQECLAPLRLVN